MKENLKKLAKYYKPYLGTFIIDMILAMMSAAVADKLWAEDKAAKEAKKAARAK